MAQASCLCPPLLPSMAQASCLCPLHFCPRWRKHPACAHSISALDGASILLVPTPLHPSMAQVSCLCPLHFCPRWRKYPACAHSISALDGASILLVPLLFIPLSDFAPSWQIKRFRVKKDYFKSPPLILIYLTNDSES